MDSNSRWKGELNICVLDWSHMRFVYGFFACTKKDCQHRKGICSTSVESVSASDGFSSSSCTLNRRKPSDCWKSKLICSNSSAVPHSPAAWQKSLHWVLSTAQFSLLLCVFIHKLERERRRCIGRLCNFGRIEFRSQNRNCHGKTRINGNRWFYLSFFNSYFLRLAGVSAARSTLAFLET